MTRENEEYEFARKIIKREAKNPNVYSNNRKDAIIERVAKEFGEKGIREFVKEFNKELRHK
jgi:hypothetical protein